MLWPGPPTSGRIPKRELKRIGPRGSKNPIGGIVMKNGRSLRFTAMNSGLKELVKPPGDLKWPGPILHQYFYSLFS
jgi:hypothetical protein